MIARPAPGGAKVLGWPVKEIIDPGAVTLGLPGNACVTKTHSKLGTKDPQKSLFVRIG
jgi:hypothetical protein